MILTTLCYVEKDDSYLMLHRIKKKEDVNAGKWIGVGGKFLPGESPEECLLREVKEETGLTLTSFRFRGIITFCWEPDRSGSEAAGSQKKPAAPQCEYMCLYTADGFEGQISDCDEGILKWIPKTEITNLNLWEGDRIFLDLLLKDEPFFSLKLAYRGDTLTESELCRDAAFGRGRKE